MIKWDSAVQEIALCNCSITKWLPCVFGDSRSLALFIAAPDLWKYFIGCCNSFPSYLELL